MMRWLSIAAVVLSFACDEAPPPVPPPTVVPDAGVEPPVTLRDVRGEVERRTVAGWAAAQDGDRLGEDEAIRTGPQGHVTLALRDEADVELEGSSEVTVQEVSEAVAQLRLERGRLGAEVKTEKLKLRIAAAGTSVVAEAKKRESKFSVYNNGRGLVAVVAESSGVKLESAGGVEELEEGQQAKVVGDGAPELSAVPKSVYLKVAWPEKRLTRDKNTMVVGKVDVGTLVKINGTTADVGEDGSFRAEVPLAEGKNQLAVIATDLSGREKKEAITMRANRKAPKVKADTKSLWK